MQGNVDSWLKPLVSLGTDGGSWHNQPLPLRARPPAPLRFLRTVAIRNKISIPVTEVWLEMNPTITDSMALLGH